MSQCKFCKKRTVLARLDNGQRVELDKLAPIYETMDRTPLTNEGQFVRRIHEAYIAHAATCPNQNEFEAIKKEKPSRATQSEQKLDLGEPEQPEWV
jgi:hypothetical protein